MSAPTDRVARHSGDVLGPGSPGTHATTPTEILGVVEISDIVRFISEPNAGALIAGWTAPYTASMVSLLKEEADRHWLVNPNESLRLAQAISSIGALRDDEIINALGLMARGDALKYLGRTLDAWNAFQQAGQAFLASHDEVGWARTRIGMLVLSASVNAVEQALTEAERARAIFQRIGARDLLTRLDINLALVYSWIGDAHRSLAYGAEALQGADAPNSHSRQFLGLIYTNCGSVHANLLGDYRTALHFFEQARAFAEERHDTRNIALAQLDIAFIASQQGRYAEALKLLRRTRAVYEEQQLGLDATHVDREIVECFVQLRRFAEARDLAWDVVEQYRQCGDDYNQAHAFLNLATTSAELGDLIEARRSIGTAEALFKALRAQSWVAVTLLRGARLALREGDAETALRDATAAHADFVASGHRMQQAQADVLRAESLLLVERPRDAAVAATAALVTARTGGASLLRYSAHLALGRVAEREQSLARADREYRAAIAAIDRVQRDLTITLRPGFLEDKGEALRALVALRLSRGDAAGAFSALEHAKSQAHLEYSMNRDQLHWAQSPDESHALLDEFEAVRDRHRWLFNIVHSDPREHDAAPVSIALPPENAVIQLAASERKMRTLAEQMYLNAGENRSQRRLASPTPEEIQTTLEVDSALIEFYAEGSTLYAFVIDRQVVQVTALPIPLPIIERMLAQFHLNVASTLRQSAHLATMRILRAGALRLLEQLYSALLSSLRESLEGRGRLYVVPFGVLHYLPFHLLRRSERYLIQDQEIVVLPSAGLLRRAAFARPSGARILAYSAEGYLPHVLEEARVVREFFGGESLIEGAANRAAFAGSPTQILHIAAHAAFRLDQPDFSYIELADGQLYADDLMQHDLSYELVTLSACETGRAHIAARDELIGLGRGFLYTGAGALIASLWRVGDEIALPLMRHLYSALANGASKAGALRSAQVALLAEDPDLHPALWGPFQLMGDARPLTQELDLPGVSDLRGGKEI